MEKRMVTSWSATLTFEISKPSHFVESKILLKFQLKFCFQSYSIDQFIDFWLVADFTIELGAKGCLQHFKLPVTLKMILHTEKRKYEL